jgi:hypothetical protein
MGLVQSRPGTAEAAHRLRRGIAGHLQSGLRSGTSTASAHLRRFGTAQAPGAGPAAATTSSTITADGSPTGRTRRGWWPFGRR